MSFGDDAACYYVCCSLVMCARMFVHRLREWKPVHYGHVMYYSTEQIYSCIVCKFIALDLVGALWILESGSASDTTYEVSY